MVDRRADPVRAWLPFVVSFGVYLIPLVGPTRSGSSANRCTTMHRAGGRSGAWVATEFAVALAAQIVVGAVVAWALRGRRIRLIVPLAAAPVLIAALEFLNMVAIPAHSLVEPETAPELSSLVERCAIPGAVLIPVRVPASRPSQPFITWWAQRSNGTYVLVRPGECRAVEVDLPRPTMQPGGRVDFTLGPVFSIADGTTVFERSEIPGGRRSWRRLAGDGRRFERLPVPSDREAPTPVLSNDGDVAATLERVAVVDAPSMYRVRLRAVRSPSAEAVVDLSALGPASYVIAGFDRAAGLIWLWSGDRMMAVNQDGAVVRRFAPALSIRPQVDTWVASGEGVLQWDAYRDHEAYRLAWTTPEGSGQMRIPLGRSITSAALDPSGRFVAVSTTTAVSVGSARDAVYVLRTRDGREVFRRYLPTYARSTVGFFAGHLFASGDLTGTHVLQLPEA